MKRVLRNITDCGRPAVVACHEQTRKAGWKKHSWVLVRFRLAHFALDQLFHALARLGGQLPAGAFLRMMRAIASDHLLDNAKMLLVMRAWSARRQMRVEVKLFSPGEFPSRTTWRSKTCSGRSFRIPVGQAASSVFCSSARFFRA
jgi:hypothetical protein